MAFSAVSTWAVWKDWLFQQNRPEAVIPKVEEVNQIRRMDTLSGQTTSSIWRSALLDLQHELVRLPTWPRV